MWYSSTVQSILQNEKYKGDALLQKSYTVDFLTKKKKIIVNTKEPYGNAITSLRMKRNAILHTFMKTRLKRHLSKLSIA